jgi:hypothetical protein
VQPGTSMRTSGHERWLEGRVTPEREMWRRARHGRLMTNAARAPVRPATRCIHMVAMASARVLASRMVVSRRASSDFSAVGGPALGHYGHNACIPFSLTSSLI